MDFDDFNDVDLNDGDDTGGWRDADDFVRRRRLAMCPRLGRRIDKIREEGEEPATGGLVRVGDRREGR